MVLNQIEDDMKLFWECISDGDLVAAQGFLLDAERLAERGLKSGEISGTQYVEIVNVNLPLAWNRFYAAGKDD